MFLEIDWLELSQILQQFFSFGLFAMPLDHVEITRLLLQPFQQRLILIDNCLVLAQPFLVIQRLLRGDSARCKKSTLRRNGLEAVQISLLYKDQNSKVSY